MDQFVDLIRADMQKVEEEFHLRLASQVPRLTEMDLQGCHLTVEVNLFYSCRFHKPLQLLQQVKRGSAVHIRKKNV